MWQTLAGLCPGIFLAVKPGQMKLYYWCLNVTLVSWALPWNFHRHPSSPPSFHLVILVSSVTEHIFNECLIWIFLVCVNFISLLCMSIVSMQFQVIWYSFREKYFEAVSAGHGQVLPSWPISFIWQHLFLFRDEIHCCSTLWEQLSNVTLLYSLAVGGKYNFIWIFFGCACPLFQCDFR